MTANFDSPNSDQPTERQNQSNRCSDVLQRDRFEMLSAYLDGEVSADERRQVEDWLANDPTVQRLHSRLLKLRQAFQAMPVPTSDEQAVQESVNAVLARVERRPRLSVLWGGVAIAAVAIGAIASTLVSDHSFQPQIANNSGQNSAPPTSVAKAEPLLVALDKPLVTISETSPSPSTNNTVR